MTAKRIDNDDALAIEEAYERALADVLAGLELAALDHGEGRRALNEAKLRMDELGRRRRRSGQLAAAGRRAMAIAQQRFDFGEVERRLNGATTLYFFQRGEGMKWKWRAFTLRVQASLWRLVGR